MFLRKPQPTPEPTEWVEYVPEPTTAAIPGGMVVFIFLAALASLAFWFWRWSLAQDAAQNLGVDSGTTTAMMLTNPDDAMASLVSASAAADRVREDRGTDLASRLEQLEEARSKGLISEDEYRTMRERILHEG